MFRWYWLHIAGGENAGGVPPSTLVPVVIHPAENGDDVPWSGTGRSGDQVTWHQVNTAPGTLSRQYGPWNNATFMNVTGKKYRTVRLGQGLFEYGKGELSQAGLHSPTIKQQFGIYGGGPVTFRKASFTLNKEKMLAPFATLATLCQIFGAEHRIYHHRSPKINGDVFAYHAMIKPCPVLPFLSESSMSDWASKRCLALTWGRAAHRSVHDLSRGSVS